jgi:hypothetical protein
MEFVHREDEWVVNMENLLKEDGAGDAAEEAKQKLQEAYMDLNARWRDRDGFLKMMLLDGCFLLEVMRTAAAAEAAVEQEEREPEQQQLKDGDCELCDYAANDPIFSRHGERYVLPYIRRDMLVMENQIPLLVLQRARRLCRCTFVA